MKPSFAFFLLILFPVVVAAQNGTVRGKVRTVAGATLTNVIVELWQTGARTAQAVTTNDGDFQFPNVTPANYEVIVHHPGFQPTTERVAFTGAQSEGRLEIVNIEVRLRPIQNAPAPAGIVFAQNVPFNARLAYETAVKQLRNNQPDEALAKLYEAIGFFPDYFNARFLLATELSKRKRSQEALEQLEQARRINDRDARVYRLFGVLMAQAHKFVVAEFSFREAIQRDPAHAQTYQSRAVTLLELAQSAASPQRQQFLADAERDLSKALELSQDKLAMAHLQLAKVHELRGEKHLAVRELETYLKLQPDARNAADIRQAIATLKR